MLAAQNQGGSKKVILILIRFIIRIMSNQTRPELWQVVVDECIHHTKFWKVTWCILSGSGIIFVVKLTLFYIFKVSKSEPCSPKYSKIVISKSHLAKHRNRPRKLKSMHLYAWPAIWLKKVWLISLHTLVKMRGFCDVKISQDRNALNFLFCLLVSRI